MEREKRHRFNRCRFFITMRSIFLHFHSATLDQITKVLDEIALHRNDGMEPDDFYTVVHALGGKLTFGTVEEIEQNTIYDSLRFNDIQAWYEKVVPGRDDVRRGLGLGASHDEFRTGFEAFAEAGDKFIDTA